jgi:hypothetical protein
MPSFEPHKKTAPLRVPSSFQLNSAQTITRHHHDAVQPEPQHSAGLPSPAVRQPCWPSPAAAVPGALPPHVVLLAGAVECQAGTARSGHRR